MSAKELCIYCEKRPTDKSGTCGVYTCVRKQRLATDRCVYCMLRPCRKGGKGTCGRAMCKQRQKDAIQRSKDWEALTPKQKERAKAIAHRKLLAHFTLQK